jgi:hypothetical protein
VRIHRLRLRERPLTRVWVEAGVAYGTRWEQVINSALGPLADDPDAVAIVRAVLEPSFFESVRAGTRTTEEVSTLITAAISPWFATRVAGRAAPRRQPPMGAVTRGSRSAICRRGSERFPSARRASIAATTRR